MSGFGFQRPKPFSPFRKSCFSDSMKNSALTRVLSSPGAATPTETKTQSPLEILGTPARDGNLEKREIELGISLMNSYDQSGKLIIENSKHMEWEADIEKLWKQITAPAPGTVFDNPYPCLEYAHANMDSGMISARHLEMIPILTEAFELITRVLISWWCKVELRVIRSYVEPEEVHRDLLVQMYLHQHLYFPVDPRTHLCDKQLCSSCNQFYYREHAEHHHKGDSPCLPVECFNCAVGQSSTDCQVCACDPRRFTPNQVYFSCLLGKKQTASGDVFVCRKTGFVHLCGKRCRGTLVDPKSYESICTFSDTIKEPLVSTIAQNTPSEFVFRIYQREISSNSDTAPGKTLPKTGVGKDRDLGIVLGGQTNPDSNKILASVVTDVFSVTSKRKQEDGPSSANTKTIETLAAKFTAKTRHRQLLNPAAIPQLTASPSAKLPPRRPQPKPKLVKLEPRDIDKMIREALVPIGQYMETHLRKIKEKDETIFRQFTNRKNCELTNPLDIFTRLKKSDPAMKESLILATYFPCLSASDVKGIRDSLALVYKDFIWGVYSAFRDNTEALPRPTDHPRLIKYLLVCIMRTQNKKNYNIPLNTSFIDDSRVPMLHELVSAASFNYLDGFPRLEKMNEGYHVVSL